MREISPRFKEQFMAALYIAISQHENSAAAEQARRLCNAFVTKYDKDHGTLSEAARLQKPIW